MDWDLLKVQTEAKKYETRKDFYANSPDAYCFARKNGWLKIICSHMKRESRKSYWTFDKVKKEAKKYKTRSQFCINASGAYNAAYHNGWLYDICQHMVNPQKPFKYWTLERITEEAKKYSGRKEFRLSAGSAYETARLNGWLDEVCSHMKRPKTPRKRKVQ